MIGGHISQLMTCWLLSTRNSLERSGCFRQPRKTGMIAARFIHHAQTRWEDWFGRFSPQFLPLATPRSAGLIVATLLRVHDLKIGGAVLYYESLCRRKRVAQL